MHGAAPMARRPPPMSAALNELTARRSTAARSANQELTFTGRSMTLRWFRSGTSSTFIFENTSARGKRGVQPRARQ
jgi:hypothetical protein